MARLNGGRLAAIVVVTVLAGTYGIAYLMGRSGEPVAGPVSKPSASAPAVSAPPTGEPAGTAEPADAASRQGETGPEQVAGREPGPDLAPVAATQPFTGPGRPPLPRSSSGPYGSRRTTGADYVALTFDDGPDPRWTPEVLALLRKHEVIATFCVVGQLVAAYPQLVRDIAADGHTLCNHTWNHDMGLGNRSSSEIRDDLERTNAAIQEAVPGARVSYYRQPGGAWTSRVVDVAEELGMSSLHWAVDPHDWRRPGAGAIASEVNSTTTEGAIVLLHDGGGDRHGTVRALRSILSELTGRFHLDALPPGIDLPRRHGIEIPPKPGQL